MPNLLQAAIVGGDAQRSWVIDRGTLGRKCGRLKLGGGCCLDGASGYSATLGILQSVPCRVLKDLLQTLVIKFFPASFTF